MFTTYKTKIESQLNKIIKILVFDQAEKYELNKSSELYANFGIIHQNITPYTPQQNVIAERKKKL